MEMAKENQASNTNEETEQQEPVMESNSDLHDLSIH